MALSQISVRIDDELKNRTDEKMKQLGTSPTQAITLLYQYIDENGKLPFTVSTRLLTTDDYTRRLITTTRAIHHFWSTLCDTLPTVRKSNGMAFSMALAAQISSLRSDLKDDCGSLTAGEVVLLMDVMESMLSVDPSFYRGGEGSQELQDKIRSADQVLQAIEKYHGMPVQRREE
ncbi:type II toxin-antitoxin system RelB/DinJ family antitoxin [Klebsiella aerogenes]|uniref:type II toxin-antitoxin system RelB/DinJ family antitoxin n=1 Tax=Klebsiella aerogenes TaxID=548 RepID=UPI000DA17D41|nr:type II toxin-antitoxin system RelB/DinJ family antitoxin [Klebsiella aerogenes]HCB2860397.1 type II toxin-antitoxin system RelB/DinJ family antitoxin [Klebsiella aerogenes]HCB2865730.1 type II toxin-antitoxin system RelB/DinJ family antitoxin [Klebsiella aerogenes]HCB2881629.1 type II toxin-antitoxin system RelB/DinJ family antitoxin [Klebsiella aerogenes]HCB3346419.1 type II toxin-antitoxin system RelB/DinJ family antitoxin [Klebsiella aerogenes]HCM1812465.1 type II toxin-antitoxin system